MCVDVVAARLVLGGVDPAGQRRVGRQGGQRHHRAGNDRGLIGVRLLVSRRKWRRAVAREHAIRRGRRIDSQAAAEQCLAAFGIDQHAKPLAFPASNLHLPAKTQHGRVHRQPHQPHLGFARKLTGFERLHAVHAVSIALCSNLGIGDKFANLSGSPQHRFLTAMRGRGFIILAFAPVALRSAHELAGKTDQFPFLCNVRAQDGIVDRDASKFLLP